MHTTTTLHTVKLGQRFVTRVTRNSLKVPHQFPEEQRIFTSSTAEASYEKARIWVQDKFRVRPLPFGNLDISESEWLWVQGQDKEEPLPSIVIPEERGLLDRFISWLTKKL